jgi:farnesyl-diphosphate farnesyltransferase
LAADHAQLWMLLRDTSRSFYLTLRLLPSAIRPQIGVAYLLARTTDTVADTDVLPVGDRIAALERLRRRVLGQDSGPVDLRAFATVPAGAPGSASSAERELLGRFEEALHAIGRFSAEDQHAIRGVLDIITRGQELDLRRFGAAGSARIVSLEQRAETDEYTYLVAGCVGEFWTRMCSAHLFGGTGWDEAAQRRDGVRFGKGLQWVNILRDLPRDLRQGRCYLPRLELEAAGLRPEDLLDSTSWPRLQPVYEGLLDIAEGHLAAGWEYTRRIPSAARRVRVACALPILIGVRTLGLLRGGNPLDAGMRIKVDRAFVRAAMWRSCLAVWGLHDWERLWKWAAGSRAGE